MCERKIDDDGVWVCVSRTDSMLEVLVAYALSTGEPSPTTPAICGRLGLSFAMSTITLIRMYCF